MTTISIASDFSPVPGGRYPSDGDKSGVHFRNIIVSQLEHSATVNIDLRGVVGLPASFLEEAFGGLIREEGFKLSKLEGRLHFVGNSRQQRYIDQIKTYMRNASVALDV